MKKHCIIVGTGIPDTEIAAMVVPDRDKRKVILSRFVAEAPNIGPKGKMMLDLLLANFSEAEVRL